MEADPAGRAAGCAAAVARGRGGGGAVRILIVTDAWEPQVNGVVRTLKSTQRELERMGHEVELLTPAGFRTLPCPTYPDIRLSLLPGRGVRRRIRAFAPQAIHIATEGPLGIAARAHALRHGLKYTTAYHTRFPEYVRARTGLPLAATYRYLRWFHGRAEAVMVPTEVVRRDLVANGFPPAKVVLWSRGVDLDVFKPGPDMPHDLEKPIFLCVGRVAVEKNIEAFLRLELPGSKWVAGEGPALAKLKAQFPDVRFTGVLGQAELASLYNAADVFVFPSRTDTFGLVLLEALACGCPVAAYPVTGPVDVIGDSPAGALDEDLRAAALRALTIPRAVARRHAERFSWEACTRQFLSHLHPFESGPGRVAMEAAPDAIAGRGRAAP
jgi:glycosyltransferase involved in cell wall biosynthesis